MTTEIARARACGRARKRSSRRRVVKLALCESAPRGGSPYIVSAKEKRCPFCRRPLDEHHARCCRYGSRARTVPTATKRARRERLLLVVCRKPASVQAVCVLRVAVRSRFAWLSR